ncbi:MAG: hypothetical protein EXQ56_05005 [Acidobacteria bacterium]|nr:hypothetical protein [Acidobacteriota bacterium]
MLATRFHHFARIAQVRALAPLLTLGCMMIFCPTGATAQMPNKAESKNMELVGTSDLQGRPAYQPVIHQHGNRWIAYIGLHVGAAPNPLTGVVEGNGTMIVDVTNPRQPRALAHIPGDRLNTNQPSEAQMVRVCDIAGGTYLLRDGGSRTRHEVWNVTDPAAPKFTSTVVDGLCGTHKNWWECDTGVAYLPSQDPRWRNRMTKIYDLSDPAHPKFIRDFGLPGQEPGATSEPAPPLIHGSISYKGRVYMAYGSSNHGVIQILDREKLIKGPAEPTAENLRAPQIGRIDMPVYWGGHTAYPMLSVAMPGYENQAEGKLRDILIVASETTRNDCTGPRHPLFMMDITNPETPFPISSYQLPDAGGNFCDRGGRFGAHSVNESFAPVYYGKLSFVSYFNAGVRALDVRDPFNPTEVGHYIPPRSDRTQPTCTVVVGQPPTGCKTAVQTNNVETDPRGYIYIVDRAGTGMHILQLSGDAKSMAGGK